MEVVTNVHEYFQKENICSKPLRPFNQVQQRTADATGLGLTRVRSICREKEQSTVYGLSFPPSTPGRHRSRQKTVTALDSFVLAAIRRKIQQFYLEGQIPTLSKILFALKATPIDDPFAEPLFDGSRESLRVVLTKQLGFKFSRINGRKHLLERSDVVALRHEFLRQIRKVEFNDVIFLDETWVNENHSVPKCWQSPECNGVQVPIGKGRRLILLHAGSSRGFVNDCLLLFPSKSGKADYHDDMNAACFTEWFQNKLLPNVPSHSVIVMDNAPYHSVQKDKAPTSNSRKQVMQDWLVEKGISYDPAMLKAELYELVKLHKSRKKKYEIDEMAAVAPYFCRVIRLPPYHCQFNPIELIWSDVKRHVAKKNSTFKLTDVKDLTVEAVASVSADSWRKHVEHVKKDVEDYWTKDGLIEAMIEPLIISVNQGNSSDSSQCGDDSTDDDFDT